MAVKTGIDVSEWQKSIDYAKAKKDGVYFVIPRSSLGFSTIDPYFMQNVAQARANDILVPAIYHFSYALTKDDADREARFAVELAEKAGLPPETIIFYDLEYDNVDRYAKQTTNHLGKIVNITKTKASEMAVAFCDRVKAGGFRAGIYANTDYISRMFTKTVINRYILWHADYIKGHQADDRAMFFQYTSIGKINGINGDVDLNEYMGDVPLEAPKGSPLDKKSNEELANEVIEGKWGNGDERKKKLEAAGYDYNAVQKIVNEKLTKPIPKKSNEELAKEVVRLCEEETPDFRFSYDVDEPIEQKIGDIVTKVYGGKDVEFTPEAKRQIRELTKLGYGNIPVCMAKTQYSFSDDANKLGAPEDFTVTVRNVKVSAGAGFIVALTGEIMTMPGLPKVPSAEKIDVDENGVISGLF